MADSHDHAGHGAQDARDAKSASAEPGPSAEAVAGRIDSHLHLWELAPGQYSWLKPELGVLYDSFTAQQAQKVLTGAGVKQAILVQADDAASDNRAMLASAQANEWIIGVVGWLPLEEPAKAAALLEELRENPKFCGVRTLLHDDPRADVLEFATVRETLGLLERASIAFDVPNAFPRHLGQVAQLAKDFPELRIVIDHLGKPPRGDAAAMAVWEAQMRTVAQLPNTVAKMSGLHTEGAEFSARALRQVWDITLEAFGPHRIMFGGDWPVSLLGASYVDTVAVAQSLIDPLSANESQAIWAGTSLATYLSITFP